MNERFIDEFEDYILDSTDNKMFQCNSWTKPNIISRLNKLSNENEELKRIIANKNKTQLKTLEQLYNTQKELQIIKKNNKGHV